MALGVGDGLLVGALVGELPPDLAHGPLLVGELLDPLDPVVRDAHRHPEVEAHAAGRQRGGQAGHAGDVLGDGEGVRVHLLHEDVREGEVGHRVLVDTLVEIVVVAHEILSEAVVPIEHRGDAVEAETVDVVFLHPVLHVRQEEVLGLVLAVVEAAGAPGGMAALRTGIEVQVVRAVEVGQALGLVVHAVAVDDVHHHGDALAVGVVHQALELLGRAEAGAQGEEIGHLVAEGTVVGMLLQGHDLEGVVAEFLHLRKDGGAEVLERGDLLLLGRHADVAFIDHRMRPLAGPGMLPDVFLGRIPHLRGESLRHLVLDGAGHVGREALPRPAGPLDIELVQLAVLQHEGGQ